MSDYPITFHYCSIQVMYDLEYYVYHLRPYGILSGLQDLNVHTDTDPAAVQQPSVRRVTTLPKIKEVLNGVKRDSNSKR